MSSFMSDPDLFSKALLKALTTDNQGRPIGKPKNKLTYEQKQEIREAIIEDNKRIEHERFHGDITAKRHPSLRPSVLAGRYKVSAAQIRTATKGLA